ncbi:astacin-like metalloprotease toxin 5 [Stegodyphus dumicola]|uniref:astacin-like metalloprotease toxin 5 n=1 Tax=Stegodyphus dumicola TaxID=202533 RepID=UPI0015B34791|nr:astacin-like metalloprotease toxin 5 [Stegodyphus dumicola]
MRTLIFSLLLAVAWATPVVKNPMINEGLFEGDIMGIDPDADRNAIPRDSQRWPNGVVPYEVDEEIYPIWDLLMKSMRHIEERSCIRFKQRTNEKDYIRIVQANGCWSFWGRLGIGEQKVSLGRGCEYLGTVVHELLHALGFIHEQNRSDRDDYLIINWQNISPQWQYAFRLLKPHENRLLTPFDYDSVMLYGETAFSIDGIKKSMEAKDGRHLPNWKSGMSASDEKRLKMLYNCQ